jgi:hypothetical protein
VLAAPGFARRGEEHRDPELEEALGVRRIVPADPGQADEDRRPVDEVADRDDAVGHSELDQRLRCGGRHDRDASTAAGQGSRRGTAGPHPQRQRGERGCAKQRHAQNRRPMPARKPTPEAG